MVLWPPKPWVAKICPQDSRRLGNSVLHKTDAIGTNVSALLNALLHKFK